MKNIKREALLVPIIGLLILSYHMGYFLSDWAFWQVYGILAVAYFICHIGLKKKKQKMLTKRVTQPDSKQFQ
jgi:sterol desaturase/sphingolipid hydroxylase (fatty acid hydroxylase superfamily)